MPLLLGLTFIHIGLQLVNWSVSLINLFVFWSIICEKCRPVFLKAYADLLRCLVLSKTQRWKEKLKSENIEPEKKTKTKKNRVIDFRNSFLFVKLYWFSCGLQSLKFQTAAGIYSLQHKRQQQSCSWAAESHFTYYVRIVWTVIWQDDEGGFIVKVKSLFGNMSVLPSVKKEPEEKE